MIVNNNILLTSYDAYPLSYPTFDQFTNTTDAGSGSVTFSGLGGATMLQKVSSPGAFVQMKLTDLTNAAAVVLTFDHLNNAVYDWNTFVTVQISPQPSFDIAVYSNGTNTYYATHGGDVVTSLEASQVNDIIRLKRTSGGFQILRKRSGVWAVLLNYAYTYQNTFYIKVINATTGASKQVYDLQYYGLTDATITPVSGSDIQVTYSDLVQSTDAGSGTITFNNAALPNGASINKRFGPVGSYVKWTLSSTLSQSRTIVVMLCETDDLNYNWSSTTGNFMLAFYINSADIIFYGQNTDLTGVVSTGVTATASDVLRIYRVGQNEVLLQRSTDGGANYTTLKRIVSCQFSKNPFIKVVNAVQAASKRINNVTVYGGVDKSQYTIPSGFKPLVVMTGESNSGGIALNSSASAGELDVNANVKIFDNTGLVNYNSLDIGSNNLIGHAGLTVTYPTTAHSWELELSNMVDRGFIPANLYMIKTGQGGTKTINWQVGNTDYLSTNCWQIFLDRTDAGIAEFDNLETDTALPLVMLTIGINDRIAATNTTDFYNELTDYIERIKTQLGVDTRICATLIIISGESVKYNNIIRRVCVENDIPFVFPQYLSLLDTNHWDYRAKKVQTRRMIEELLP